MKNLLILLLSLITFSSIQCQSNVIMEDELTGLFREFILESQSRDYYIVYDLFQEVDSIMFDETIEYPKLGFYNNKTKTITLTPFLQTDKILLKLVLFHELGHALLGEKFYLHSCSNCSHIMSQYMPENFCDYSNPCFWESTLDEFFIYINKNTTLNLKD